MLLAEIAATSRRVTESAGRLEKIGELAQCLARLSPDEVEIGVGLLSGEPRQGRLNIGPALLASASPQSSAPTASLELAEVDGQLTAIAAASGSGSTLERTRLLSELLGAGTRAEQEFLWRLLIGELRQGASEGLMVEAIARAHRLPAAEVRRATMLAGSAAKVARVLLTDGPGGLGQFSIRPFSPVLPMLAQPADDVEAALRQLGRAALEWKLDGARVQVHKSGNEIGVFTRSLNDVTGAVPEIVEAARNLPIREVILDGEAIALQPGGMPYPFQVTMRRFGRKRDIARMRERLPLSVYFFDNLYTDSETLIDQPQGYRFAVLERVLPSALVIPHLITSEANEAESFFERSVRAGHEGLMAKSLNASYEAGGRGNVWLKIKQARTLDLVVLAAEWGHGRRRGWLSNLHLGARDASSGRFVMLGKTFKGMTDAMLTWQTDALQKLAISRDAYTVYVKPELVVEIAFGELQESAQYPGGLALRFARIKRYRPDKKPEDADTLATVRAIYAQQLGNHA